ncbi:MAG: hypothetical protein K2K46_07135 [Lachnospiraceae bacterium]|nr:hypothetical protein [Lachnospiraceae bacterium]
MKNKCKIGVVLTFVIVFLFYKVDSVVAIANEQFDSSDANLESTTESETEQGVESVTVSETEQNIELSIEPEDSTANVAKSETEPTTENASVSETTTDYISTGPALIEWLEAHKNTGGSVKLTDNVVLNGYYAFCPCAINMPPVFVDTDKYTITIAGEIEFLSDDHLTFLGQPDSKGIFYVAPKGSLSISGVIVESGQCALWQEEGAGLVLEDCHISGSIHYADTPFVMYNRSVCVVVEKGQTVNDVLPTQLACTVNRQGDVSYNEAVPVSWMLEGTEKQQEERLRFQVQGSFLQAASSEALCCTVVYNDYPLTFTDMKASLSYNAYLFLGGYTKPEDCLPITVISEYSFDGENWLIYEEKIVSNVEASFILCLTLEQWDTATYPHIYIRQQWNDNGIIHFSNVLCYAADNLECEQDIGGSRGGGTSITNPPDEPQQIAIEPSSGETDKNAKSNSGSGKAKSEAPSATNQTENGGGDNGSDSAGDVQSSNAGTQNSNAEQSSNTGKQSANTDQSSSAGTQNADAGLLSYFRTETDNNVRIASGAENKESINHSDSDAPEKEEKTAAVSLYEENSVNPLQITEHPLHSGIIRENSIVIAIVFVVLSVIAGIVGFRAHASLSGTNR